jgi:hypothetical protein
MQRLEGHPFNQQVAGEIVELWPNVLATVSALRSFDSWSKPKTQGNDEESEAQGNEPPKPLPQLRSICYLGKVPLR